MGSKTTVWILPATKQGNYWWNGLDMPKKKKSEERNGISFNCRIK